MNTYRKLKKKGVCQFKMKNDKKKKIKKGIHTLSLESKFKITKSIQSVSQVPCSLAQAIIIFHVSRSLISFSAFVTSPTFNFSHFQGFQISTEFCVFLPFPSFCDRWLP